MTEIDTRSIEERMAAILVRELDEHDIENDDEKRYQLACHLATVVAQGISLTEEVNECVPISVPTLDDDGNPIMDERLVIQRPKRHFEWVRQRRWVTPREDAGPRETTEEFHARLRAAYMSIDDVRAMES